MILGTLRSGYGTAQGGPGSVRFGYGVAMERFEQFRFSVPAVPVFQYSFTERTVSVPGKCKNLFGLFLTSKGYFKFSGYLK